VRLTTMATLSRHSSHPTVGSITKVKVGLCAMDKKVSLSTLHVLFCSHGARPPAAVGCVLLTDEEQVDGKPMKELIKLMSEKGVEFVRFGDDMLLNMPVESWPVCDCLIAFYSDGFPLDKAMQYNAMYPDMFCINDLDVQNHLFDRRWVYKMCDDHGIPTPRHVFCNRGEDERGQLIEGMVPKPDFPPAWKSSVLEEFEDYIIVDGLRIDKPFVEKPASGEDHNVWIYYPRSAGGGIKKLFRKVGNKSSDFAPNENKVRRDGSYIYEEFMPTEGIDVKVYAVGDEYAHAEARKSPVVDGVVARSSDGKEVRYPIILSRKQKRLAHDIVMAFKQTVCGFDLLVCGNKSYVCDVNGWSFVKSSKRFWQDASNTLSHLIRLSHRNITRSGSLSVRGGWRSASSEVLGLIGRKGSSDNDLDATAWRTNSQVMSLYRSHPSHAHAQTRR
jgi:inositol hexakisphosphate/diphosphoinositol-pentakisphosphate kinase